MMSLIADLNNKEGKGYGQECKGDAMCLGGGRSSPPPPTKEEKEEQMEREAQKEIEIYGLKQLSLQHQQKQSLEQKRQNQNNHTRY